MRLKGKIAFVIAADQGIGKASALAVAAVGATAWAIDVNNTLLARCAGVTNIHTAVLDVMDKSAIQEMISGLPAFDVLFEGAGFAYAGTAPDATDDQWDFAVDRTDYRWLTASMCLKTRCRPARTSSPASRWAGSPKRMKLPPSWSLCQAIKLPLSSVRLTVLTAA